MTVEGHSAVFDDLDLAARFVRNGLSTNEFRADQQIAMESEWMSAERYREEIEAEDETTC